MSHPLDGAFDRVRRAEEHLADLKRRITEAEANTSLVQFHRAEGRVGIGMAPFQPFDRPSILSILVGEIIYNLRAALDYLIFELARLDSGQVQHGTQFLIESAPEGFMAHKEGRLKGINASHVARIERLQPYQGCQWTKTLVDISNPDKHRTLTVLFASAEQVIRFHFGSEPSPQHLADPSIPKEMHVQNPSIKVAFDDGTRVVDMLEEIKARVAETLDAFQSEF